MTNEIDSVWSSTQRRRRRSPNADRGLSTGRKGRANLSLTSLEHLDGLGRLVQGLFARRGVVLLGTDDGGHREIAWGLRKLGLGGLSNGLMLDVVVKQKCYVVLSTVSQRMQVLELVERYPTESLSST